MRFSVHEQQVFGANVDNLPLEDIRDAGLLTKMAKKKYLFGADVKVARQLLQQALLSAPYSIPAWLSLAELNNDEGQKRQTRQILEYIDQLTAEIHRYRWEKTLVDYQVGRTEMLPGELSYIIEKMPGKSRRDALQLAFTLWDDPADLLAKVGQENVEYLLDHTIARKLPEKGLFFWQVIQNRGRHLEERKILSFLNMLLGKGEVRAAGDIWRTYFNAETILFNQDFENRFLQQAFGWRAIKSKAFTLKHEQKTKENSARTLHYRFKGWENLNFHHLYQIVPVTGGQMYEFTGEYKTRNLTTDQRPFIEVYGYQCKNPYRKSEMVEASEDWTNIHIAFGVSDECQALVVRLRRLESRRIDNKLSGQLWLRNFEIVQTGELYTAFDEL
ncbi:hypothetical protein [Desulforhopalus sp. 52FAK]